MIGSIDSGPFYSCKVERAIPHWYSCIAVKRFMCTPFHCTADSFASFPSLNTNVCTTVTTPQFPQSSPHGSQSLHLVRQATCSVAFSTEHKVWQLLHITAVTSERSGSKQCMHLPNGQYVVQRCTNRCRLNVSIRYSRFWLKGGRDEKGWLQRQGAVRNCPIFQ